jgi:mRNA-degrading endonuclease RelE of RelBE toxin-antitoxin system
MIAHLWRLFNNPLYLVWNFGIFIVTGYSCNEKGGGLLVKQLNIDKSAQKQLDRTDGITRRRIADGILGLFENPPKGDIKSLSSTLQGLMRLRIGSWRITYEVTKDTINILAITPRGGAYKKGV